MVEGSTSHVPEAGRAGVLIEPLDARSSTPSAVELVENRRVDALPTRCTEAASLTDTLHADS